MNKNQYDFTLVVAAYNVEEYINSCVDSILESFRESCEIIIINDGSTDDTYNKIARYKNLKNVILISQENQGLSSVRNKGIELAHGEYIVFIDGDDFIDYNTKKYFNFYKLHDFDIVISDFIYDIDGKQHKANILKKIDNVKNKDMYFIKYLSKSLSQRYFVKTDILKKYNVKFPIGLLHEDVYWGCKMSELISMGKFNVFYNTSLLWYYYRKGRENSIMSVELSWRNLLSVEKICIMLEKEINNKDLLNGVKKSVFCFLRGYYNAHNPSDKLKEIINLSNKNKNIFKTNYIKYIPFYVTLFFLGFEKNMKLWKKLIIN